MADRDIESLTPEAVSRIMVRLGDRAHMALANTSNIDSIANEEVLALLATSAAFIKSNPPPAWAKRLGALLDDVITVCCCIEFEINGP